MADLREVFVLDAVRTPIGMLQGGLAGVRPDDLLAGVLRALLERTQVAGASVDEVVAGCSIQAGEDARNVARLALLLAGMPNSVPGLTVNRLCASGLTAVNASARQIACGEAEIVIAAGVESSSRAPLVVDKGEEAHARGHRTLYDTSLGWRFPNPRIEALFPLEELGATAENLAEQARVSRDEQDAFALASHERALAAETARRFDEERVPVALPRRTSEPSTTTLTTDEGPRQGLTLDELGRWPPAFRRGGTVTLGNSSPAGDGAAAVMLVSLPALQKLGRRPLARWLGGAAAGVNPRIMGSGPVPAVERLLHRFHLPIEAVELFEIHEVFAATALAVVRQLGVAEPARRVNVNGGAIALGDPAGASGVRLMVTLVHEMWRRGTRRGVATMSAGVGLGEATLLEGV